VNLQPFTVARYGVYVALGIAVVSLALSRNAGIPMDVAAARSIFIFVAFAAIAFGAEAVLLTASRPLTHTTQPVTADESVAESTTGVEDAA
jgi:prolipoprotein diacylglyceryltransferase